MQTQNIKFVKNSNMLKQIKHLTNTFNVPSLQFLKSSSSAILTYNINNTIVSFIYFTITSIEHFGKVLKIEYIFTHPDFRRQSLNLTLLNVLYNLAHILQITTIVVIPFTSSYSVPMLTKENFKQLQNTEIYYKVV